MKRSELLRHIAGNIDNNKPISSDIIFCNSDIPEMPWENFWAMVGLASNLFTIKNKTSTAIDVDVPPPMTGAGDYWLVNIEGAGVLHAKWNECIINNHRLKHGLCFATKEHAELNRKAQLKINPYGEGE